MSDDELEQPEGGAGATHRVIRLGESLRQDLHARRRATEQTVRGFVAEAVEFEVPALVVALQGLGLTAEAAPSGRPARLPLATTHVRALRAAAATTGLPASLLLRVSLGRLARRKRRRAGAVESVPGEGCPSGNAEEPVRAGRRPRRAAGPPGPDRSPTPTPIPADRADPVDVEAPARAEVPAAADPPALPGG